VNFERACCLGFEWACVMRVALLCHGLVQVFQPTMLGSAGTQHCSCGVGYAGGGAFFINATATLSLNGSLIADGATIATKGCAGTYPPGAGSGGSIWVSAGRLLYSTGLLRANGGAGVQNTGLSPSQGAYAARQVPLLQHH